MNRTERLFALIDALRRHRRPVTAASLAEELAVSVRTIYRDVQSLVGLGAPIDGEAGIGYMLRPGFFLPPLSFDETELEALVLGARWVARQGDPALARAAENAIAKIGAAAPANLRDRIGETGLWAPPSYRPAADSSFLPTIREAIRHEQKLAIGYVDEAGRPSERTIWPIGLAFYDGRRTIAAWCELRQDYRHFRADRIETLTTTGERYPTRRAVLVKAWRDEMNARE